MKKLGVNLLMLFGKAWAYLYSHNTSERVSMLKVILYSAWISGEFKSFGKMSSIHSHCYLLGVKYISIGDGSTIGKRTILTAWDKHGSNTFIPQITIGHNVSIGEDSHITAINKIEIGNNVLTGNNVTITANSHGKSNLEMLYIPTGARPLYSGGPAIITDNVCIGDKVTILPNVRIGKDAIIGANAVGTRDIPSNCVAGGITAKVIKLMA